MINFITSIFVAISTLSIVSNSNYISFSNEEIENNISLVLKSDFSSYDFEKDEDNLKLSLYKFYEETDGNEEEFKYLKSYLVNNDPFFASKTLKSINNHVSFTYKNGGSNLRFSTFKKILAPGKDNGIEYWKTYNNKKAYGIYIDNTTLANLYNETLDVLSSVIDIDDLTLAIGNLSLITEEEFIKNFSNFVSPYLKSFYEKLITSCKILATVLTLVGIACVTLLALLWYGAMYDKGLFIGFVAVFYPFLWELLISYE